MKGKKKNSESARKKKAKGRAAPVYDDAFCPVMKKRMFGLRQTVGGLRLAIDMNDILKSDRAQAEKLAAGLRERADAVVLAAGYRIPVYLVFCGCESVGGFRELFSGEKAAGRMPVVGAFAGAGGLGQSRLPASELFSIHYEKVCNELSGRCLLKLIDTEVLEERRRLCRLVPEFLLAEGVLSAFAGEFFRGRDSVGPQFGGFFFTLGGAAACSDRPLDEAISNAKFRMGRVGEGTPFYRAKRLSLAAVFLLIVLCVAGSGLRDAFYLRSVKAELSVLCGADPTLEGQYAALEKLRQSREHLRGGFRHPGRFVFRTNGLRGKIMGVYAAAARQIMVGPAVKHMEASMRRKAESRGELTADEHSALYRTLETYLLLTGGKPPAAEVDAASAAGVFEQALKNWFGRQYKSLDEKVVKGNISAVIKLAAENFYRETTGGGGSLPPVFDEKTVQGVRERLAQAPRAETVYGSAMEKLRTPRRVVPMNRIVGKSEIVKFGREVSALYTRDGWEQTVYAALIDASKDPFKNDWVMGPVAARVDEDKLLSEMVMLYANDLCVRWLDFIKGSVINLSSDMPTLAYDLEKLASRESEAGKMLAAVCSLAVQQPGTVGLPQASASDIKGQIKGLSNKLRGGVRSLTRDVPDPFAEARRTFGTLDVFLTGGAYESYRAGLGELAESVKNCAGRGNFAAVFASRGEEPIGQCRRKLAGSHINMPANISAALKGVLEAPLDFTASAVAKAVSAELQESWSAEVVNYCNERIAGRYPVDKAGTDLAWSDFDEFFKPRGGILWKYVDKNLSGLAERTPRGWARSPHRLSIPVSVSEEAITCINRAEKIAANFYKSDGAPKRQDITFSPFTPSSGAAEFLIGSKRLDFQGGLPVAVSRPTGAPGGETVILRVMSTGKAQEELRFGGEWSLMKFLNAGKIDRLGSDRYRIRWVVNVQNIYTVNVVATVQSGQEILFDESAVKGFDLPARVLKEF